MIWPGVGLLPTRGQAYIHDMDEVQRLAGLTFMQPYASAVIEAGKRVENRSVQVPRHHQGRAFWLCVHAGLGWYPGADKSIRIWRADDGTNHREPDYRAWPAAPATRAIYPTSCVLGFARVVGCFSADRADAATLHRHRAWMAGPWCWLFDPVVLRLPAPIATPRGALGLWALNDRRVEMPPELQAEVRRALVSCLYDRATWRTA